MLTVAAAGGEEDGDGKGEMENGCGGTEGGCAGGGGEGGGGGRGFALVTRLTMCNAILTGRAIFALISLHLPPPSSIDYRLSGSRIRSRNRASSESRGCILRERERRSLSCDVPFLRRVLGLTGGKKKKHEKRGRKK